MLDSQTFACVVSSAPLISVDLIVRDGDKILLGKRVNPPAKGYFFTTGGRVFKNEKIDDALMRVAKEELGITLDEKAKFLGVYEHFYHDSIYPDVDTHYVNLGFEIEAKSLDTLPKVQHSEYRWFGIDEISKSTEVHIYVKDYFNGNKIC